MAKSFENSKRAKHIDIKYHFLKDFVNKKLCHIEYVPTDHNIADVCTKALTSEKLSCIKSKLNILS